MTTGYEYFPHLFLSKICFRGEDICAVGNVGASERDFIAINSASSSGTPVCFGRSDAIVFDDTLPPRPAPPTEYDNNKTITGAFDIAVRSAYTCDSNRHWNCQRFIVPGTALSRASNVLFNSVTRKLWCTHSSMYRTRPLEPRMGVVLSP